MKLLLELFWSFAKIGAFTFGGGYAMLPMFQKELVDAHGWTTSEELMDYYAISQCTPGVIAVNAATFVGYKQKGVIGGIVATLGVVFPSIVIICIIAAFIRNFADMAVVKNAFAGIRVCVCVLIFNAVAKLWKNAIKDWVSIVIYLAVLALALFTDISKIFIVIGVAVISVIVCSVRKEAVK